MHDDVELLASGAAEHQRLPSQAELAAFVREQESYSKTLRRDSSDASSLSTLDDRSECSSSDAKLSSECRLSDEFPEDAIWGEVFVTRIQAWYRGCASSQTRKEVFATRIQAWYRGCASRRRRTSLPDSMAETQVAEEECEEEPFKPGMEVFATRIQAWYRGCVCRWRRKLLLEGMAGPQVEEEEPYDPEMHAFATHIQAWYKGCASRQRSHIFSNGTARPQLAEEEPFEPEMHVFATCIQAWYRGCASRRRRNIFLSGRAGTKVQDREPLCTEKEVFATRIQAWYGGSASRQKRKVASATRIQAWYKRCVSRQKRKLFLSGTAGAQAAEEEPSKPKMVVATRSEARDRGRASPKKRVSFSEPEMIVVTCDEVSEEEEEPFEPDMALFTGARLSTSAFEERVRNRAYHLFLAGCRDARKNYFDALEAERKLAHVHS